MIFYELYNAFISYHSYVVLVSGFYFAPRTSHDDEEMMLHGNLMDLTVLSRLSAVLWS